MSGIASSPRHRPPALVAGIAWVLINEDLVDQPFLEKYCVGYDEKTLRPGAGEWSLQSRYPRRGRRRDR